MDAYHIHGYEYHKFLLIAENSFKVHISEPTADNFDMVEIYDTFLDTINLKNNSFSVNNAVYIKVKDWMERELSISINHNIELERLIPKKHRKKLINKLLDDLEIVYLNPFKPFKKKKYLSLLMVLSFLAATVSIYINFTFGIIILLLLFAITFYGNPFSERFNLLTLKDFTDKLAIENYSDFNPNDDSINYTEVRSNLLRIFSDVLGKEVTIETRFVIIKTNS